MNQRVHSEGGLFCRCSANLTNSRGFGCNILASEISQDSPNFKYYILFLVKSCEFPS